MTIQLSIWQSVGLLWSAVIPMEILAWGFGVRDGTAWGNVFWSLSGVVVVAVAAIVVLVVKSFRTS